MDWSKSTIFNEELVEEIPRIEDDIKLLQQKNIPAVLALDTIMGQTCENCISYTANQILISTEKLTIFDSKPWKFIGKFYPWLNFQLNYSLTELINWRQKQRKWEY